MNMKYADLEIENHDLQMQCDDLYDSWQDEVRLNEEFELLFEARKVDDPTRRKPGESYTLWADRLVAEGLTDVDTGTKFLVEHFATKPETDTVDYW
jgi:hypothetical protein